MSTHSIGFYEGTDKQYVADSLIHSTTVHYKALYQI